MTDMVVVADSTRARIFTADSSHLLLDEIETLAHPEGRMHEQDMVSDMPGRSAGKGGGGDHAYQEIIEPREQEMIMFAKRLADYLSYAIKSHQVNKLFILAAPAFLGELRTHLSSEVSDKIALELNKNLVHHSVEEIRDHLTTSH